MGADRVREEDVVERGLAAFARNGFDGTSLRVLARELGVSHNYFNDRFGSKTAFWRFLVDARTARVADRVREVAEGPHPDDVDRLRAAVTAFLAANAADEHLAAVLGDEARREGPRYAYVHARHVAPVVEAFRPTVERLVARGDLRDVPVPVVVYALTSLAEVAAHRPQLVALTGDEDVDPHRFAAAVGDVVLHGLLRPR